MMGPALGSYTIIEKIGAGGMGVVYRARDERLGRDVALKVLPAEMLADHTAQARLLNEARTASVLNHPHICTIYEVGEANGQTYIALEHIEGLPLSQRIPSGGLPILTLLRYAIQIADALAHAHERGIVHRDLKSSNVMITLDGRAKVLDFGVAKRLLKDDLEQATRSRESLTGTGTVVGTLHYLSPEVLRGELADVRSDLWALGVLVYEMATGGLPFQGQTGYELSSAILREAPASLPLRLPAGLRAIIERCLAKERGERYQRAGEVRAALEAIQSDTASAPLPAAVAAAPSRRVFSRRWLQATGAAIVAGLVILLAVNVGGWRQRLLGRAAPTRIRSLAVLPLENLSRDPEQGYFADGMTEALITDLAQISALRVISRTSVMQYRGTKKPLPEVARELNVDGVLEGSVLRSGNRVRVTAQLIQAPTDQHLWARSYERDLRDVLALQDEVARAIANEIQVQLTPQEQARLASARAVNPEAHELYLKGRYYWNKRSGEDLKKSIEYFDQAIEKDPGYALAYTGLAASYSALSSYYLSPREAMPRAIAAAIKATELDSALAEAHTALGAVRLTYDWDTRAAERELKQAIALNPSSATAHDWYAQYLTVMGRQDEALAEIRRAQELDPLSLSISADQQLVLFMARRYDQAIEQCRKATDYAPSFYLPRAYLGLIYSQKRQFSEAIAELQKARELDDSPVILAFLAEAYALSGNRNQARKLRDELIAVAKHRYVCSYEVATVHVTLGEKEAAFKWFEKAHEDRSDCMIWLKVDPRLDGVRSDLRFPELLRRVGLPP